MTMQMMLLGSSGASRITAVAERVERISLTSASAALSFLSNGQQVAERNGSVVITGNWLSPPFGADTWEVRATLDSGEIPVGFLGIWLPLTANRSWSLSAATNERKECFLTFEFRKIGTVPVDTIVTGSSIYVEALSFLP
jgi:hypothetical protein